jgi:hypothetical protein
VDTFPVHLFKPGRIGSPRLSRRILSGGESLSGDTDIIAVDGGGRWEITFSDIELLTDDQVAAWNVWDMHLAGGAMTCVVPIALPRQAPLPFLGQEYPELADLHPSDDDPFFPNANGRALASVVAKINNAAALRATALSITVSRGRRLKGGEPFTVVHSGKGERLYRVKRVLSTSGQTSSVLIEPPLREAVSANKAADFDWPRFVARLAPNQDIGPDFAFGNATPVAATFVEAFV